ncbi:MAG: hypothetical protein U0232_25475 [Thermomicrobiales bacterium]
MVVGVMDGGDGAGGRMVDQQYLRGSDIGIRGIYRARMGLHERFSVNKQGWHRWVFERIALPPGGRLLELGCGPGELWRANAEPDSGRLAPDIDRLLCGMVREVSDGLARLLPGAARSSPPTSMRRRCRLPMGVSMRWSPTTCFMRRIGRARSGEIRRVCVQRALLCRDEWWEAHARTG